MGELGWSSFMCSHFCCHRYLFSMERNRRVFKKLFPPDLFVTFIDIGHYNSRLSAYSKLVHTINNLSVSACNLGWSLNLKQPLSAGESLGLCSSLLYAICVTVLTVSTSCI